MSLFRPEVLAAQGGRWLGSAHLAQSIPLWLGALVAFALAAALIAYGVFGSYARKAHVAGQLAPQGGEVNLAAVVAGRVAELRVKEGQSVAAGEVLLVLDSNRATSVGGTTEDAAGLIEKQIQARLAGLRNERALREANVRTRQQALRQRLDGIDSELRKLDDEVALQARRKDLAEKSAKRYDDLVAAKFVSPVQAQTQQEALIDQEARLRLLERGRLTLGRERAAIGAETRQLETQLAMELAAVDRELAAIEQEAADHLSRRTTVVVAPRAGVVSALAVGPGQFVSAGQSLAALQPADAPLEAQLYAASRTVGFVAPGQRVLLRYAAYPYQKFGLQSGRVLAVSQSAFAPSDLPPALQSQIGRQTSEALYRVSVALDAQQIDTYGQSRPLRAGMALEADIVQDRRSIVEWLFEPLFAAAARA